MENIVNLSASLLALISSCSLLVMFIRDKAKRKSGKDMFFKLLKNNFEHNFINDREDILVLLNSVNREFDCTYSLISVLEDYIVYISKGETKNDNIVKYSYKMIKDIINEENQEKPFSNVPDQEKRILRNINENIMNNQIELIKFNLQELSYVITTRNKTYEKADKINKWSLPVAIIGIIVAIIFGLMGLKNIDYNKIEEINKKLIENTIRR